MYTFKGTPYLSKISIVQFEAVTDAGRSKKHRIALYVRDPGEAAS